MFYCGGVLLLVFSFFLGGRAIHYTYMDITACLLSSTISTPPFIKYFLATFASFSGLSAHAEQSRLASRTASDTTDVLEACGSHARQAQWRHIWELASASYLDRRHRVLLWRLLHGSLMCGAYKSYIGRATPAQANCPFSCCIGPSSLRPSATCSSPAQLQPQSLIGCAAFGKL